MCDDENEKRLRFKSFNRVLPTSQSVYCGSCLPQICVIYCFYENDFNFLIAVNCYTVEDKSEGAQHLDFIEDWFL